MKVTGSHDKGNGKSGFQARNNSDEVLAKSRKEKCLG